LATFRNSLTLLKQVFIHESFLNNLDVMYVDTKLHLIFSECLLVWVCNVCTNEVYYDIGVSIAPRMVILKSGILNLCLKASSYFLCLFCWLTLLQVKSQFPWWNLWVYLSAICTMFAFTQFMAMDPEMSSLSGCIMQCVSWQVWGCPSICSVRWWLRKFHWPSECFMC